MTWEEALDEICDAETLMTIAYKKLMHVEKSCHKPDGYPLKDTIISLGTAQLTLVIIKDEYAKMGSEK